jgi:hypothetical protein
MSATAQPYEHRSSDDWARKVASNFTWQERPNGWTLRGVCPRCDHDMSRSLTELGWFPDTVRDQTEPGVVVVRCNCAAEHAGQPEGEQGCGAYGALQVEL